MAAAGDAAKVVLIDVDYKAIRTANISGSPLVRFVDSGGWRGPTRLTRRGKRSGSGSARLGLSQKGDLPSSGEWIVFIWSKAADAR
jgi:hypothetical protein